MAIEHTAGGNKGVLSRYIVPFLVLFIIAAAIIFFFNQNKGGCSNGVCSAGEDCYTCPADCKCSESEYCSAKERACVGQVCGDGRCSPAECSAGCLDDCSVSACCGNGACDAAIQENSNNCPLDCGLQSACGNGVCDSEENCFSCQNDCGCTEGEYCSAKEKECVKPTCGNKECEYFEKDCCIDCGCTDPGYVCDMNANECVFKEFTLSDDEVKEIVAGYFAGQGKTAESVTIMGPITWENKVGRNVMVSIKDQGWVSAAIVTEDGKVTEVET